MWKILALNILLTMTALGFSACDFDDQVAPISGRYVGTQQFGIGQVNSPIVIDLIQRGNLLSGTVTPPFSEASVMIMRADVRGTQVRFETKQPLDSEEITNRYDCSLEGSRLQGNFGPLCCVEPASGERCPTDLNGSFTALKQ